MSEFHNLLSRLNEKDIVLSTPKMDNSNYTEALDFLTGRELSKLKRDALAEYQYLKRQLAEANKQLKEAYDLLEYGIEDNEDVRWCDKYLNQLKEKGENEGCTLIKQIDKGKL